jgi:hypothetical protein
MTKKTTTNEFILRCNHKHNDKYDYSKVKYVNSTTKIIVICPIHGEFSQRAAHHIYGIGCPSCSGKIKKTSGQFVKEATKTHNNFYNYDKFIYVNNHVKSIIICPIHGEFLQTASDHLQGKQCRICAGNFKKVTDQFIIEANAIHNFKYDYSSSYYTSYRDKVNIICPDHGKFEQNAGSHLQGYGCSKCYGNCLYTTDDFITKACTKHNNFYNYNKSIYVNSCSKVIITCPIHGDFEQEAASHLSGCGCKKCANTKSKGGYCINRFLEEPNLKNKLAILYLIKIIDGNQSYYKIGVTVSTIKKRFKAKEYRQLIINPIKIFSGILYDMFLVEQYILQNIVNKYTKPSCISFSGGYTECFIASPDQLNAVLQVFEDINLKIVMKKKSLDRL